MLRVPERLFVSGYVATVRGSHVERLDRDSRSARAQPPQRDRAPAARAARVHHGPVRIGQVVARLRHALRRGPAPLRRVALGLRAPVPRADGQARRRLDRGPLAGDLDRPEDDLAQPALDGRHRHRDATTTCACCSRASGDPHCPICGAAHRRPVGRADRRPGAGAARRARASRSTRRSCAAARASHRDVLESLRGEGFTRVARRRRDATCSTRCIGARQEVQARHRGRSSTAS